MDDRSATGRGGLRWPTCPFVDRNDNRCTSRFSLGRIDQAFDVCFGSFRACPMYHRLKAEAGVDKQREETPNHHSRHPPLTIITAHGCALPLRPTGT